MGVWSFFSLEALVFEKVELNVHIANGANETKDDARKWSLYCSCLLTDKVKG